MCKSKTSLVNTEQKHYPIFLFAFMFEYLAMKQIYLKRLLCTT